MWAKTTCVLINLKQSLRIAGCRKDVVNQNVLYGGRLPQIILLNLVSNSIKFTKTGGTVILNAEQDLEHVTISVSDNGVGM